ncbi:MAG: hypothetical protein ACUVXJ_11660 [Phycisphaerae bacterium]
MSEPWFDANTFGTMYGIIGRGIGGTLCGVLAPRGKGRRFVVGSMAFFLVAGAVQLIVGLIALACRQPYGIWYPMVLCGVILVAVMGPLIPVIRTRYAQLDQRRIDAEAIRRS